MRIGIWVGNPIIILAQVITTITARIIIGVVTAGYSKQVIKHPLNVAADAYNVPGHARGAGHIENLYQSKIIIVVVMGYTNPKEIFYEVLVFTVGPAGNKSLYKCRSISSAL